MIPPPHSGEKSVMKVHFENNFFASSKHRPGGFLYRAGFCTIPNEFKGKPLPPFTKVESANGDYVDYKASDYAASTPPPPPPPPLRKDAVDEDDEDDLIDDEDGEDEDDEDEEPAPEAAFDIVSTSEPQAKPEPKRRKPGRPTNASKAAQNTAG